MKLIFKFSIKITDSIYIVFLGVATLLVKNNINSL